MKARTASYCTDRIPDDKRKLSAEIALQVAEFERKHGPIKTTGIEPRSLKPAAFTIRKKGRQPAQEIEE